jgi:hypothetical protein
LLLNIFILNSNSSTNIYVNKKKKKISNINPLWFFNVFVVVVIFVGKKASRPEDYTLFFFSATNGNVIEDWSELKKQAKKGLWTFLFFSLSLSLSLSLCGVLFRFNRLQFFFFVTSIQHQTIIHLSWTTTTKKKQEKDNNKILKSTTQSSVKFVRVKKIYIFFFKMMMMMMIWIQLSKHENCAPKMGIFRYTCLLLQNIIYFVIRWD